MSQITNIVRTLLALGLGLAMCVGVSGCKQGTTKPSEFVRVTNADISQYLGKKLSLNGNHLIMAEDGTFAGMWNGGSLGGTWEMKDDYWCRVLTEFYQADRLNQEDCQLLESSGALLRGTRNKGSGQSFVYQVE
ncbi:MAG: hypothetical protein AAF404_23275 [Pseudomonadota bacterium]